MKKTLSFQRARLLSIIVLTALVALGVVTGTLATAGAERPLAAAPLASPANEDPAGCFVTNLDLVHANAEPNLGHTWPDASVAQGTHVHLAGTAHHYARGSDCSTITTPLPFTWSVKFESPTGQVSDVSASLSDLTSLTPQFTAADEGTYLVDITSVGGTSRIKFDVMAGGVRWINIGPNNYGGVWTGRVNAIAFDPRPSVFGTMYAGSANGGVWRSTDYGANWVAVTENKGLPSLSTSALAVSSDGTVYVSTGDDPTNARRATDGIYKSVDGGLSWQSTTTSPGPGCANFSGQIWRILKHPTDPNTLFAAGEAGLMRTTNAAGCWQPVAVQTPAGNAGMILDIAFKPGDPNTLYALGSNAGVIATTSPYASITSWSVMLDMRLITPLIRGALGVSADNPQALYADVVYPSFDAAGKAIRIFRSTDAGGTWEPLPMTPELRFCTNSFQCNYNFAFVVNPFDANDIFHGDVGAWRFKYPAQGAPTESNWQNWSGKGAGTPGASGTDIHGDVHALVFDPFIPVRIFLADDGGVALYDLAGPMRASYRYLTNGLTLGMFNTLSVRPSLPGIGYDLAGGLQDNATQVHLMGSTWVRQFRTGGDGGWTGYDAANFFPLYQFNVFGTPNVDYLGATLARLDPGSILMVDPYRTGVMLGVSPWTTQPITRGKLYYTNNLFTRGSANWTCIDPTPGNASDPVTALWPARVFPAGSGGVYYVATLTGLYQVNVPASPAMVRGCATGQTAGNVTLLFASSQPVRAVSEDPSQPCLIYAVVPNATSPSQAWRIVRLQGTPSASLGCANWSGGTPIAGTLAADLDDFWPEQILPHAIAADPISPSLLYLGTDRGLYTGRFDGATWNWSRTLAIPAMHVTDIRPHLAAGGSDGELYLATYGRGVYKRIVVEGGAFAIRSAVLANAINRCQVRPHQTGDESWQMVDVEVELSYNGDHGSASLRPVVTKGGVGSPYFSREVHAVTTGTATYDLRVTYSAADAPPGFSSDGVRIELVDSGGTFLSHDCELVKTWRRPDARAVALRAFLRGEEGAPPETAVPITLTLSNGVSEFHQTPFEAVITQGLVVTLQVPSLTFDHDELWAAHSWSLENHAETSASAQIVFTLVNDSEAIVNYLLMAHRIHLPLLVR